MVELFFFVLVRMAEDWRWLLCVVVTVDGDTDFFLFFLSIHVLFFPLSILCFVYFILASFFLNFFCLVFVLLLEKGGLIWVVLINLCW
jgi:hypothetical protein